MPFRRLKTTASTRYNINDKKIIVNKNIEVVFAPGVPVSRERRFLDNEN